MMDSADSIVYYDDENEFTENGYDHHPEYEYEYEDSKEETLTELYQYCLTPSIYDTAIYIFPLLAANFLFRFLSQLEYLSPKMFHAISTIIGIYIIQHYALECLHLLVIFVILSYIVLLVPKTYRRGTGIFLPSLFIILYCEFLLQPVVWHKIRNLIMTVVMKAISITVDTMESNNPPSFFSYLGYMFCSVTCLFGPWISYKDYNSLHLSNHQNHYWPLSFIKYGLISFFYLSLSNCWIQWIFAESSWKWLVAYKDALAFRSSHYFISYLTSSVLILGGYPLSLTTIVKPIEIEFPRSLVQVVVSWNIPMHFWLKTYIFRPSINKLGKFGAVAATYLTSAFLHGLNFQLAAVLFSLGLYTYIEFQLRAMLSNIFDACIASKKCTQNKCLHALNATNSWWVVWTNLMFSVLSIFHLSYLGLMFDTSDLQEIGYSYHHTVNKWSQLDFASHWVVLATYCIYFLIK